MKLGYAIGLATVVTGLVVYGLSTNGGFQDAMALGEQQRSSVQPYQQTLENRL